MKAIKTGFAIALLTAFIIFAQSASAEDTEIINFKADSTWKAASFVTSTDWFKSEYDDSTWSNSAGRWANNPCVKYCGKMTSCEMTCVDWMWYNQSCANCENYFRKTVNLPEEVMSAKITITADKYYWLYVNNNYIGSDTSKSGYQKPETYDITSYLIPGKNVISIKAQSDGETQGVALTGEIKYKSYNTLITQMQNQIDSLGSQLNTVSNDKNRLQSQVDVLLSQNGNLTKVKDELSSENSRLQVENLELKNTNSQLEASISEAESSLNTHKVLNIVLIVGIVIAVGALIAGAYMFYEKMKGRRPRLSEPSKKFPTERIAGEKEATSLSEEKTMPAPVFQRKEESTLSGKWGK